MQDLPLTKTNWIFSEDVYKRQGVECSMVLGDRFCIKVTYPEDLTIAEALYPLFIRQEKAYEEENDE